MAYVEYSSNNSGGNWWLKDEDWHALEKAGWVVHWAWLSNKYDAAGNDYIRDERGLPVLVPSEESDSKYSWDKLKPGERWLGALAREAYRPDLSLEEAVAEWERVTGANSTDAGCPCCGVPHHFTERDDNGKYGRSGPESSYSASWA